MGRDTRWNPSLSFPVLAALSLAAILGCASPPSTSLLAETPAPDWRFAEGDDGRLSDLWPSGPLVVIWLRHYG